MPQQEKTSNVKAAILEQVRIVVFALILALLIRTFAIQFFIIPSGSMIPTLLVGDYIVVSKYSYGYSRYSLPFDIHVFNGRLFLKKPQRGDVVVFRAPNHPHVDYVKRVIGLPGDRIQVREGLLYINGKAVGEVKEGSALAKGSFGGVQNITRYQETLPNGVKHPILKIFDGNGPLDNTQIYAVPEGHFFAMGDNRDNSSDSRVFGFVPFVNLIGKARIVVISEKEKGGWWKFWKWRSSVRWDRSFTSITSEKK